MSPWGVSVAEQHNHMTQSRSMDGGSSKPLGVRKDATPQEVLATPHGANRANDESVDYVKASGLSSPTMMPSAISVLEELSGMFDTSKPIDPKDVKRMGAYILHAIPVYRATTWFDRLVAIAAFLERFRNELDYEFFYGKLRDFASAMADKALQGAVEYWDIPLDFHGCSGSAERVAAFLERAADSVDTFHESIHMAALQKILAAALANGVLGANMAPQLIWAGMLRMEDVYKWRQGEDIPGLISNLSRLVSELIKTLFQDSDPNGWNLTTPNGYLRAISWLHQHEYARYNPATLAAHLDPETLHKGFVSDDQWMNLLRACDNAQHQVESKNPSIRTALSSSTRLLRELIVRAQSASYGQRPLPFNIALWGSPGLGKSTWIVPAFATAALRGLGVDFGDQKVENVTATVNVSDTYMSRYIPWKHLVVFLDELGAVNAKNGASANGIMSQLTNMLGEAEYFPSKAEAQDKGKVSYRPFVNILASNRSDFGIADYIAQSAHSAFYRRVHVAFETRAAPEYAARDANGNATEGIDFSKVEDGNTSATQYRLHIRTPRGFEPYRPPPVRDADGNICEEVDENGDPVNEDDKGWLSFEEAIHITRLHAVNHSSKLAGLGKTRAIAEKIARESTLGSAKPWIHQYAAACKLDFPDEPDFTGISAVGAFAPLTFYEQYGGVSFDIIIMLLSALGGFLMAFICQCWASQTLTRWRDEFQATRAAVSQDIRIATHAIERAEMLITRWDKVRRNVAGAAVVAGIAGIGLFMASTKFAPASGYESFEGAHTESDASSAKEEEGELFGSRPPPNADAKGNSYDHNQGVCQLGKCASVDWDVFRKKVDRNTIFVQLTKPDGSNETSHLFCVGGQFYVGAWHFVQHFGHENSFMKRIIQTTNRFGTFFTPDHGQTGAPEYVRHLTGDLGMCYLPGECGYEMTNYFPVKLTYTGDRQRVTGHVMHTKFNGPQWGKMKGAVGSHTIRMDGTMKTIRGLRGQSDIKPYPGLCGSPLVVEFSSRQRALCGFVTAMSACETVTIWETVDAPTLTRARVAMERTLKIRTPFSRLISQEQRDLAQRDVYEGVSDKLHTAWRTPEETGTLHRRGFLPGEMGRKARTTVRDFKNAEAIKADLAPLGYTHNLVAPQFNHYKDAEGEYVSPERNAIQELAQQVHKVNYHDLLAAVDHYTERLTALKDHNGKPAFGPVAILDAYTAINGDVRNNLVSSLPKDTSAGWPFRGKKHHHLVMAPTEQAPHGCELTPEMRTRVVDMIDCFARGERWGVVYKTCLKDEPRDADKVKARKIRLFTLGPMDFLVVTKMYYGMFMALFTENFIGTETVGGVNCFSPQWGSVMHELQRQPRVINGDFSKFDKKTSTQVMMAAFTVIINVTKRFYHLTERQENVMLGIASEIASPTLLMDQELLDIPGSLSSGVLLTFVINNIVNSLYIRLAWQSTMRDGLTAQGKQLKREAALAQFDKNVVFYAMGDDNCYTVSQEALEWFNFRTIKAYFADIGLKYTNAAKTDDEYGSLPISEATICKRKWVFDEEYQIWKAPLEKASILKALTIGLVSKSLTADEQQLGSAYGTLIEFAQYGREEYEQCTSILLKHFPTMQVPSYDSMMDKQKEYGFTPWVPEDVEMEHEDFPIPLSKKNKNTTAKAMIQLAKWFTIGYCGAALYKEFERDIRGFTKRSTFQVRKALFHARRAPGQAYDWASERARSVQHSYQLYCLKRAQSRLDRVDHRVHTQEDFAAYQIQAWWRSFQLRARYDKLFNQASSTDEYSAHEGDTSSESSGSTFGDVDLPTEEQQDIMIFGPPELDELGVIWETASEAEFYAAVDAATLDEEPMEDVQALFADIEDSY